MSDPTHAHPLAHLLAVLAQNGPTPLHPDDIKAAHQLALTVWVQDSIGDYTMPYRFAVWLRADPKPEEAA